MATTTNYGWTTPDDTALVKDGAAAIRTLGSSVDTTTKALNPSTTLGDIEYRSSTANTNTRLAIGTSGQALTVVAGAPSWAASSTSVLTTSGDTLYASAANTLARLGIGSTGQVLTVAAGVPSWATPGGSSITTATATVATNQNTNSTSYTDLTTAGPEVTLTTGTKALVIVTCQISGANESTSYMSYAVSGATTIAANDAVALMKENDTGTALNESIRASAVSQVTLTAGSNTFTAKYKQSIGGVKISVFRERDIFVMLLN